MRVTFATSPALGKTRNEDRCGIVDNFAWVLDGASIPTGLQPCCHRDATWFVDQLASALAAVFTTYPRLTLREGLADAIQAVTAAHRHDAEVVDPHAIPPSATIALAHRRHDTLDYLVLGDAAILLDTSNDVHCITDDRLSRVAVDIREQIRTRLRAGTAHKDPELQNILVQLVKRELAARNQPGGYWIASDDPQAALEAIEGTRAIGTGSEHIRRVALLTDGALNAVTQLDLYNSWATMMNALITYGPAACLKELRKVEAADLSGLRFPRSKPSDDATALLWDLGDAHKARAGTTPRPRDAGLPLRTDSEVGELWSPIGVHSVKPPR
jgi:hypothetical protein